MLPTTVVHSGSNVVLRSFPHDRQSVNIAYHRSDHNFFYFPVFRQFSYMEINTLLTFFKEVTSETFIGQYKGKKAAVDTSCWLHKALTISVQ